jgi:hypothetical protein
MDWPGDLTRHECGFQHEETEGTEQEIVRGMIVRGMRIFNTKIAKQTKITKVGVFNRRLTRMDAEGHGKEKLGANSFGRGSF